MGRPGGGGGGGAAGNRRHLYCVFCPNKRSPCLQPARSSTACHRKNHLAAPHPGPRNGRKGGLWDWARSASPSRPPWVRTHFRSPANQVPPRRKDGGGVPRCTRHLLPRDPCREDAQGALRAPSAIYLSPPRGGGSQLSWGLTTSPQVPTRILGPGLEVDLGTAGGVPALWEVPSAPGTRAAGAGRCGWAAEEAESPVSQHRSRPRKVHARRPVPPRTSVDMAGEGCCRRPGHMLARSRCSREL